jgi:hypothetical protein
MNYLIFTTRCKDKIRLKGFEDIVCEQIEIHNRIKIFCYTCKKTKY